MIKSTLSLIFFSLAFSSLSLARTAICRRTLDDAELFKMNIDRFGKVQYVLNQPSAEIFRPYYFGRNFDLAESQKDPLRLMEITWAKQRGQVGYLRVGRSLSERRGQMGTFSETTFRCK